MACTVIKSEGFTAIACSRGGKRCKCGNAATKLCDYPVTRGGKPGTCDADLCGRCARHVGPDKDYCPAHVRHMAKVSK